MNLLRLSGGGCASNPAVVCLGFFDGVHIGHQRLICSARDIAQERTLTLCVHTFDRMPARVLAPREAPAELTSFARKARLLSAMGVDLLAVSRFEEAVTLAPATFFKEILLGRLRACHLVAGYHHRFGHGGKGDVTLLRTLCERAGIGLMVIDPVTLPDGELVSSTAIRQALAMGDSQRAARMLGRTADPE